MRKIVSIIQYPRMLFANMLYFKSKKVYVSDTTLQQLINKDMKRFFSSKHTINLNGLNYLLASNKVFRTIFYYRIQQDDKLSRSLWRILSILILPPLDNIEIGTKEDGMIAGGLKIMHSSGCVIVPHSAGENLTVFQGVTIGDGLKISKHGRRNPIIGDNVTIMPNSVVAGGIVIGNNVTVGAGSIILKDVPDNCVVVGNPARIIEMNGECVNMKL